MVEAQCSVFMNFPVELKGPQLVSISEAREPHKSTTLSSELGVLHLHIPLFIQSGKETLQFMLPSEH